MIKTLKMDLRPYRLPGAGIMNLAYALLFRPGFLAVILYRISRGFLRWGPLGKLAGLVVWRINVWSSACYISPRATIGHGLELPHATGIVIGDGVVIHDNVKIYQNVTLGAKGHGEQAYPTIESDAVIFPGAVVVGPVTIGKGACIGANSFVSSDVLPGVVVAGAPARTIR